jgi:Glyoxalase superfamily protein
VTTELRGTTPVLRIFDLPLAKAFYVDYLGGQVDWEASSDDADRPVRQPGALRRAPGHLSRIGSMLT